MTRLEHRLYTAQQLEELLGKKYFYRQSFYRLAEEGLIDSFNIDGTLYFSSQEVIDVVLQRLVRRLRSRFPWLQNKGFKINFDQSNNKIYLHNQKSFALEANTTDETEEDFLKKIETIRGEVIKMPDFPIDQPPPPPYGAPPPPSTGPGPHHPLPPPPPHHEAIMDAFRRIEEALRRIEDKLG